MEPRSVERFTDAMAGAVEEQAQTLSPSVPDRATGFYLKARTVEGLLRMLVFQSQPGEKSVCVADLVFTREQFQEMARIIGMPRL